MPRPKNVDTLLCLCCNKLPRIVNQQVTTLTSYLVDKWWQEKTKHEHKRKRNNEDGPRVVLVSGRVREMEEVVVNAGDLEFEFKEDLDQYDLTHIELNSLVSKTVQEAIVQYREYILEWPVVHIVDIIANSVIGGIEDAIVEKNSLMHLSDKPATVSKFNMEMFLILKFLDVITVPNLSKLDLRDRLQPVRNHLYENLQHMKALQILYLGDASHGYTPDLFQNQFLLGLGNMKRIVHFSLHFDCFDKLLNSMSLNCSDTLRVLDIELSKKVTDKSIEDIKKFKKLIEINIFSCGFTSEGQAKLLLGLPNLLNIYRGDFLCEALEWVDWMVTDDKTSLKIQEFFYSESYHFHTVDQMRLVARYCPTIQKIRFMFSKEHFISFQNLNLFQNVQSLHICGGDFYSDNLLDLLEDIGAKLTEIDLYAVDQLDMKTIAMISIYCKKLVKIVFRQCGFKPTFDELFDEDRALRANILSRPELPVEELIQNFDNLRSLKLNSECGKDYVRKLLSKCFHLKHLELGRSISLSDADINDILSKNSLIHLEEFSMKESENGELTILTVENLIDSCPNLKSIRELRCWVGVFPREIEELQQRAVTNNWEISFGDDRDHLSEEALRRAGLKEKFDRLREQFGDRVMIP